MTKIVRTKSIIGGKPRISGTRISINLIADYLSSGLTVADIKKDYPHLTDQDIAIALRYLAERIDSERGKIEPQASKV